MISLSADVLRDILEEIMRKLRYIFLMYSESTVTTGAR